MQKKKARFREYPEKRTILQRKRQPPCTMLRIIHGGHTWMGSIIPSSTFLIQLSWIVFSGLSFPLICTDSPSGTISIFDCPHGKHLRCIRSYITADSPLTVSWDLSLITMLPDGWPNRTLDHILLFLVIYFYRSRRILSEFDLFSVIDARLHTSILQIFRPVHSLNCRALVGHRNHPSVLCVYNIQQNQKSVKGFYEKSAKNNEI